MKNFIISIMRRFCNFQTNFLLLSLFYFIFFFQNFVFQQQNLSHAIFDTAYILFSFMHLLKVLWMVVGPLGPLGATALRAAEWAPRLGTLKSEKLIFLYDALPADSYFEITLNSQKIS